MYKSSFAARAGGFGGGAFLGFGFGSEAGGIVAEMGVAAGFGEVDLALAFGGSGVFFGFAGAVAAGDAFAMGWIGAVFGGERMATGAAEGGIAQGQAMAD